MKVKIKPTKQNGHISEAEFEDLGLIDKYFVSKLTVGGKEYINHCAASHAKLKNFAMYRYRADVSHFSAHGYEIIGYIE